MQHEVLIRFSDERQRREPGTVPGLKRGFRTDAGWDLPAWMPDGPMALDPGEKFNVPTGVCIMPPPGVGLRIIGRSSTSYRYGLEVIESIIDPGYQGALLIELWNRTRRQFVIQDGVRLAQVIFFPILSVEMTPVHEFPPTPRGTKGHGSTGMF